MNLADLKQRITRLEELARGLSKEVALWKGGHGPLRLPEHRTYLNGILEALCGIEEARVTLARVAKRLEAKPGPRLSG